MAIFNASSVDRYNIGDQKVRDYLYKLNEDLTYMFNNLTPDDNYSQSALNVLAKEGEKVAELSVSVDGIFANYLKGDSLIASIALDDSGVTIKADKISLEGLVTANNYFKILTDGSMEAVNGKFRGSITASNITGSTIDIGRFYADDEEVYLGCFYAYTSDRTGAEYLATDDQTVGMGDHQSYSFWTGYDSDNPNFTVNRQGNVHANDYFFSGPHYRGRSLAAILDDLYERASSDGDRDAAEEEDDTEEEP